MYKGNPSTPLTPTTPSMQPPLLPASASNPRMLTAGHRSHTPGLNGFELNAGSRVLDNSISETTKKNTFLNQQRFAQFVLQHRGSGISTADMEKEMQESSANNRLEQQSGSNLKPVIEWTEARIAKFRDEHSRQLSALYDMHAQDYRDERKHQYYTKLISHNPAPMGPADTIADLEEVYNSHAKLTGSHEWDDNYFRLRYAQLKELQPLQYRLANLKGTDKAHRVVRRQMFPKSVEEYKNIASKDTQLRIARYLQLTAAGPSAAAEREKMLDTYQWTYRQVEPLTEVYKNDEEFRKTVNAETKTIESRDPRRRSSLNVAS